MHDRLTIAKSIPVKIKGIMPCTLSAGEKAMLAWIAHADADCSMHDIFESEATSIKFPSIRYPILRQRKLRETTGGSHYPVASLQLATPIDTTTRPTRHEFPPSAKCPMQLEDTSHTRITLPLSYMHS